MRWRCSPTAVRWFILLAVGASVPVAFTQARLEIFVTPIPYAPFSAVINVESTLVRNDGSIQISKSIRNIARDSQGRIYSESRELVPVSSARTPQLWSVHLYDPQTRVSTTLDSQKQTFRSITVKRPPATLPPTSPESSSFPVNDFTKEEDLGAKEIGGVPAHGVREIQTIPADNSDGKEIAVTDEYWYSSDLRINMMLKHDDPRTGSITLTVTQVSRTEPDPALFRIPDGYTPADTYR